MTRNASRFALCALLFALCAAATAAEQPGSPPQPEWLTNLFQLRHCAEQAPAVVHPFRIVAEVCEADSASGVLVLRDPSAVEFIRLDLQDRVIEPGATVCLEGRGYGLKPRSFGLAVVPGTVVDNDGLHGIKVESGTVLLHAGVEPITVQWFNHLAESGLDVEYEGPGLPRQRIPGSVLSRVTVNRATGATNFSAGLDYRSYEGDWGFLPDFGKLHPVKTGVATNFDVGVRTRNEDAGLEFIGFITIPRDGAYTFHVTSDDGSRLFVGELSIDVRVLSNGPPPAAIRKVPGTAVERESRPWVTLEGTVDFIGVRNAGGEIQIRVGNDEIRGDIFARPVKYTNGSAWAMPQGLFHGASGGLAPNFPPGAKVRVSGIYQDVIADDGSRVPGTLLVSSWADIRPVLPASERRSPNASSVGATPNSSASDTASTANGIPAIATVADIKALPPDLANQQLPVSIRGVVTAVLPTFLGGAVVQDSTKGIYISLQDITGPKLLQRGEFCQIEGVTGPGMFAPIIVARRITHLGAGQLPQPLHATREQLMNGSLDTQYAEIEGVVTAVHDQQIAMLTEGGKVMLDLGDFQSEDLAGCENALVRIRGCAFAFFNEQTHELDASSLRILGGAVDVLQPAPRDLFEEPQKNLGELLLFDPKAAPFRRLKVSAQVIHGRAGEFFLTDGANGIRVTTGNSDAFAVGDLVEAVGFLDLGGPAAELKEAVMRKTGHASLPAPKKLAPEQLLLARHAGMLVQVDAVLRNQWREGSDCVLELQSGFLGFKARMDMHGQSISLPPSGSHLELIGAYVPQGNRLRGGIVNGFELLLDAPVDIRVLATPPWWTLERVLVLAGILAALLGAVLVWNKELQRKVLERGRQLELEIHHRQRAEVQHAAEAERSRIARDLHDELGAGLTEVSLLASAGLGEFQDAEKISDRLRAVGEKARSLVTGLDVIVWAVDPKHNSLQSFTDYLESYTKELLSASDIVCRFKIPIECGAVTLTGTARHGLLLAVKEALNNVIRHAPPREITGPDGPPNASPVECCPLLHRASGPISRGSAREINQPESLGRAAGAISRGKATEVELHVTQTGHSLQIVIADNGRGFDGNAIRRGNGLTNMRERLEALHGQCHIESKPGKGTTVKFTVPLPRPVK
jgi:signal transduction histidine kinase